MQLVGRGKKVIMLEMTSEFPGVSVGKAKPHRVPALSCSKL